MLVEAWVVFTRPRANNGFEWSAAAARAAIDAVRGRFTLLSDASDTFDRWIELVTSVGISGKRAHDARIVASMQSNGIVEILTLNGEDFAGLPGIVAVGPANV